VVALRSASLRLWGTLAVLVAGALILLWLPMAGLCFGAPRLAPGVHGARRLDLAGSDRYCIRLRRGQVLAAVVEQHGINVVVRLLGPLGEELLRVDDDFKSAQGPEVVFAVAAVPGSYFLEVAPNPNARQPGSYRVRLALPHPASPQDPLRAEGERLFSRGEHLRRGHDGRGAIRFYQAALKVFQATGQRARQAPALYWLGKLHYELGERQIAPGFISAAAEAWSGRKEQAIAYNFLGSALSAVGESERAVAAVRQALEIARRFGSDGNLEAGILNNLGVLAEKHGDFQTALKAFTEGLAGARAQGSVGGEALLQTDLAYLYLGLGQAEKARDAQLAAIQLEQSQGDVGLEAWSQCGLGVAYQQLGDPTAATQALATSLRLARQVANPSYQVFALWALGDQDRQAKRADQARARFQEALRLADQTGDPQLEAGARLSLGELSGLEKDWQQGLQNLAQASALYQGLGDRESVALALFDGAQILRRHERLAEALSATEKGLVILDALRARPDSGNLRALFLASHHSAYELAVDLLMQLDAEQPGRGYAARAFEVSEQARGRAFLDELGEAREKVRSAADPELLRREAELERQLNELEQQQQRGAHDQPADGQPDPFAAAIRAVEAELEVVEAKIRTSSPRYTALIRPQPLKLAEVQSDLLEDGTALLAYSLGEEQSFLWLVRRGALVSYRLPPRREIEALAKGAYQQISQRPKPQSEAQLAGALARLSQMILGPAASELGRDRLLVVADAALQLIPFAVLPVAIPGSQEVHPLGMDHEVVSLPSASVLAVLRRETAHRPSPPKTVAVLADPVFASDDERLPAARRQPPRRLPAGPLSDVARSARDLGVDGFDRLANSASEAAAIRDLAPVDLRLEALGFSANRRLAMSPALGLYRIVHFATHAVANTVHPELSGIVLSLLDQEGRAQEGFLRAYEVYDLKLPVDLVVLSACQTALGPEIRGEGLSGLTRGFMYAGAPRVVVSLWNVSDKATAHLMELFYRGMLKRGLRPAAALREAQIGMLHSSDWRSPYYWAGFVLQGEWR
jgi:CHAT domain-containing protein/tetratricopeptide (TPR) repeat protein